MSAIAPVIPRVAAWTVAPRRLLAVIVLAGAGVQSLFAHRLASPTVFPDEYLYSQLGRSLATTGHLTVRGVSPHFLPVLEPILTAPMWLVGSVGLAYRLVQIENTLVFSLAAVPAYLIARRLGASTRLSLGVAALTVLNPAALFTARVLSEPFAYPLALAVVAAALAVAERPSVRTQTWLLVFSGLATFTRLQLAAVPLAVAAALLVAGRRELRRYALLIGVIGVCAVAGLVVTLVHGFGYYKLAVHPTGAVASVKLFGVGLFVVSLAAGAALVPSAFVGVALAVVKPRSRVEHVFGLLALFVAALLFAQCALWGDVTLVQERYLGYLVPFLALGFCVRATRPSRRALAETVVAAAFVCFAAAVPLSGYAVDDAHHLAPTLYAFLRIEAALGHSPSGAAAVFALVATVAVVVGALAVRFRRGAIVAVGLSLVVAVSLFAGASSWSARIADDARNHYLPADAHWIDQLGGTTTMLVVGRASTSPTLATLFWNPSVTRVVRAPGASKVDWLDDPVARVAADGTTDVHGRVVVATNAAETVVLANAKPVASYGALTVWQPNGAVRLQSLMTNRLPDGRVLNEGSIRVWHGAQLAGWIEVAVTEPAGQPPAVVSLKHGKTKATVSVAPGRTGVVRLAACGSGPWRGGFTASPAQAMADTWLSPRLSTARYVADPSACS